MGGVAGEAVCVVGAGVFAVADLVVAGAGDQGVVSGAGFGVEVALAGGYGVVAGQAEGGIGEADEATIAAGQGIGEGKVPSTSSMPVNGSAPRLTVTPVVVPSAGLMRSMPPPRLVMMKLATC